MRKHLQRLSDERFLLVIPAKAGIQALNGSRALRAISKPNCGWLRPCTLGGFLLFGQKKATKEKAARSARRPLAFLAPPGARQLAGRTLRASGSNTGSLNCSRWGCGTRRALRGLKTAVYGGAFHGMGDRCV